MAILGNHVQTRFVAETALPTEEGMFRLRAYHAQGESNAFDISVLIHDPIYVHRVPLRVHDQCLTSEVFGSLRCDCKEQLDYAKRYLSQHTGVLIYLPQEGRGIGLANKIQAYALQEKGIDTVDANRMLGFEDDYRTYEPVRSILEDLQIASVQLMTNNPRKQRALEQLGILITKRIPIVIPAGQHNQQYLQSKSQRMAHWMHEDQENQEWSPSLDN